MMLIFVLSSSEILNPPFPMQILLFDCNFIATDVYFLVDSAL